MAEVDRTLEEAAESTDNMGLPNGEETQEQNDITRSTDEKNTNAVSDKEREQPLEESSNSTPKLGGRQRRKNPKYNDYETVTEPAKESLREKPGKRTPAKKSTHAPAKKSSAKKTPQGKKAVNLSVDRDHEADGESTQDTEKAPPTKPTRKIPAKKTPVRKTSAKKTPANKTPLRKTPDKTTPAKNTTVRIPHEKTPEKKTPRGKAKDVTCNEEAEPEGKTTNRKSHVCKQKEQEVREDQVNTPEVPEETTPCGRPRRGAAKAALKYLHSLASADLADPIDVESASGVSRTTGKDQGANETKRGRGRKRKAPDFDSDSDNKAADKDFVPDIEAGSGDDEDDDEEEEQSETGDGLDSDSDLEFERKKRSPTKGFSLNYKITRGKHPGTARNGLSNNAMQPVWNCNRATKEFRDEYCNAWVFPEWIPSEKHWTFLTESESEPYLPQELESPSFTISREGIREVPPLFHKLNRFQGVPAHPERWDMAFHTGGPVWAMDWCPCPDGSVATQHVALSTHRHADEQHIVSGVYANPGLVQIWSLGRLQYDTRPSSCPSLSYGLAQDKGTVWVLKWCPSGAWELASTNRKEPLLPRLGLLAVATSNGHITIYSLPHPDALHTRRKLPNTGEASQEPLICKARAEVTLQLGSFKASREGGSGSVLSMDWLSAKPHDLLAAGFHDGVVGLWDLCSQSVLLRIRSPDLSITLMPFHCFIAHDHSTRALAFCAASRDLLATAGDDRLMKMWNLKKTYEPISFQRRYLSREMSWPLNSPGVFVAQEIVYAPFGVHGVHYFDVGFLGFKPIFFIPRPATIWTLSTSDWLNLVATADIEGDLVFGLLPHLSSYPCYIKRAIDRRFPVYFTDTVPYDSQQTHGEEEEETEEGGENGVGEGEKEGGEEECNGLPKSVHPQTFREMNKRHYLHFTDNDLRILKNSIKRTPWKRMQATETRKLLDLDRMPMSALHKVRFSPNMSSQSWMLSAGQSGLVRAHCLRSMASPHIQKMEKESQAQFCTMFPQSEEGPDGGESSKDASTVRSTTQQL